MILNLQYLRAFAALIVVLFHISLIGPTARGESVFYDFVNNWGAAGVDLFFVISGFIMVHVQSGKPRSAAAFIGNRIVRVVPLYWFFTVLWFVILSLGSPSFRASDFDLGNIWASLAFLAQALGYQYPFIVPGWTLEYEALFYVLFALCILVFGNRYFFPLILVILLLATLGFTAPIVTEFVLGMVAARVCHFPLLRKFAPGLLLLGLATFLVGAVVDLGLRIEEAKGWYRVLVWGLPSFLIVVSAVNVAQPVLRLPLLLGNASYSIYLSHPIWIRIFKYAMERLPEVPEAVYVLACILFSVTMGCLSYVFVERPVTRFLKAWRPGPARPSKSPAA